MKRIPLPNRINAFDFYILKLESFPRCSFHEQGNELVDVTCISQMSASSFEEQILAAKFDFRRYVSPAQSH